MSSGRIVSLFLKPDREQPMRPVDFLDLDRAAGIAGALRTGLARQINMTTVDALAKHGVSPSGSRVNLVLDLPHETIASGTRLTVGPVELRITFSCEPCAHGARLAGVPLARFRDLERHLACVLRSGRVVIGDNVVLESGVYPPAPDDFKARTIWALGHVPAGKVVRSSEFLAAIGGSRSYQRALPGWLRQASAAGYPGHRVLAAGPDGPSWAPHAADLLAFEGLTPGEYEMAALPLQRLIWMPPPAGQH